MSITEVRIFARFLRRSRIEMGKSLMEYDGGEDMNMFSLNTAIFEQEPINRRRAEG